MSALRHQQFIILGLIVLLALSGHMVSGVTSRSLIYLGNYANPTGYTYQARCSLPCTGSYSPGLFNVTIVLDKICSNITTSNFAPVQTSPSAIWFLNNTKTISANTNSQCVFDVQFHHSTNTVPQGTCSLGWEIPTDCTMSDEKGPVLYGWMTCDDVIENQFDACYNQTIFSRCCHACNNERHNIADCPFGDFRPWSCSSVTDDRCYNTNIDENCCKTCHDIETSRHFIPDCPYGDRDTYFCSPMNNFQAHQCYNHDYKCCETCYWEADETQPECRYGDRLPGMCNSTVISDCYKENIQFDCCRTCSLLRNDEKPNCLYGDRFEFCANILRRECYKTATEDSCCETCEDFADNTYPDCKYGDSSDCYNVTRDDCNDVRISEECCQTCRFLTENDCPNSEADFCYDIDLNGCYNRNTRQDCCYTCLMAYTDNPYLSAEGCQYGDRVDSCYMEINSPHKCYNNYRARTCCETCYYLQYSDIEDCKYGDRRPNYCWSITMIDCYNTSTEFDCCETCHYNKLADLPYDCRYGDKEAKCSSNFDPWECYDQNRADICCETCSWHDQEDELGYDCRYGDRRFDCYAEPNHICYDPNLNTECCKFCHNKRNDENVGCEYGDRNSECTNISPRDCYNSELECCDTCPRMISVYHEDIADCKYGDRTDCSAIAITDCYDPAVSYKCCETCWLLSRDNNNAGCSFGDVSLDCPAIQPMDCYNRETECCQTCGTLVVQDTGHCKYGDRRVSCSLIEPHECYDQTVAYDCCHMCSLYRRTDLPYICQYGDRSMSCTGSQHHPSECYAIDVRETCCETCPNLNTGVRGCEFGDKDVRCETVHQLPVSCYNNTVYRTCCHTCPSIANNDKPGCEYGDRYEYCEVTNCDKYSSFRLNECCHTCWDYVHSVSSTPRPSSSTTTSSPLTPDGKTEKQSSIVPIVAGSVGGVLVVAILIIVCCYCMRRQKGPKMRPSEKQQNGLTLDGLGGNSTNTTSISSAPTRYPPRRPDVHKDDVKKDEEVYDYIDDRDVRSLPSIRKPAVPFRDPAETEGAAYLEPSAGDNNPQYFNPAYQSDTSLKEEHTYHVLQKQNDVGHEYLHM
ncbi:hypothetical protein ACF0H5_022042 [Mactra antiquata]